MNGTLAQGFSWEGEVVMVNIISIALGFVLTTIVGGWWAARLQQRSWERQNDLRLKDDENKRAAAACQELTRLLDKRLYRMRRLHWAIAAYNHDTGGEDVLKARLKDYNDVLYEWNDQLNLNLAILGSYFGTAARQYLYGVYEQFRTVGARLEAIIRDVRKGEDVSASLQRLDPEFEGWQRDSLNNRVYQLGLAMMTQLREGLIGRSAPDKLAVPSLASTPREGVLP
jgi:hypothetical protein